VATVTGGIEEAPGAARAALTSMVAVNVARAAHDGAVQR
jgi:hypothetical protein